MGHNLTDNYGLSVVQAISRKLPGGSIIAVADGRKDGGVDGINNEGSGSGTTDSENHGAGWNSMSCTGILSLIVPCLLCHWYV